MAPTPREPPGSFSYLETDIPAGTPVTSWRRRGSRPPRRTVLRRLSFWARRFRR
jgi:hypothetical protein